MSQGIRLAILGAGATGRAHAAGAVAAGGFKLVAVADSIPDRLKTLADQFKIPSTEREAEKLVNDPNIDAFCICLPTHLHSPIAAAALKAGKHVVIEYPPAPSTKDAKTILKATEKCQKAVLYSAIRRFGAPEQSARQAIEKGYLGKIYHARLSLLRTRGIPRGTGWYTNSAQSGGGAIIDLGLPMIDLLTHLVAPSRITSVYATAHHRIASSPVEESGSILIKFEDGATAEVSVAWAINQPATQAGMMFRLSGESGAIDLYTPQGPVLFRGFDEKGQSKAAALKQPKSAGYVSLFKHFKECIQGKAIPLVGAQQGVAMMELVESIYQSVKSGKAIAV